jgi:hypothetical protein
LIGLPVQVTVPKLRDLRWRYCTRWDEGPAARLGSSLLRLGICRAEDWSGSAVDFVERGFKRFCKANGAEAAGRVWQGNLRIRDHMFEMTELERNQVRAEMGGSAEMLFLAGDFSAASSIPIGSTLSHLEREHKLLPAAFYSVLVHNLGKWMGVYQCSDALEQAEMSMIDMEEEEIKESFYPEVEGTIPDCLRKGRLKMRCDRALSLLKEIQPRLRAGISRQLVARLLDMHNNGRGYVRAVPYKLVRHVPGLEDYLDNSDGCGPGCLISWHEGDAISACFDEEMRYLGQHHPLAPTVLLAITLDRRVNQLDKQVRRVFEYAGTMLRSLAGAAKIVEIIRETYDEYLRGHRLKSGLQTQPGTPGVREQQL